MHMTVANRRRHVPWACVLYDYLAIYTLYMCNVQAILSIFLAPSPKANHAKMQTRKRLHIEQTCAACCTACRVPILNTHTHKHVKKSIILARLRLASYSSSSGRRRASSCCCWSWDWCSPFSLALLLYLVVSFAAVVLTFCCRCRFLL